MRYRMSFVAVAVGVGVASAGVGIYSQSKAANEQNRYRQQLGISQNKQYVQNAQAVVKDVGLQIDQMAQREIQQSASVRQELENITRSAMEAGATARTQTAAAGVEGRSVDVLHNQFRRDVAEFESAAIRNVKTFRAQSAMEAAAIYARGQNAINQGYPNPLPPPATISPATSILNGITTGLSVYAAGRSFAAPDGIGATANPATVANNPNAPYFLQAAPTTPWLLAR